MQSSASVFADPTFWVAVSFVLFFVLAFGIFGFLLKQVIQWWLGLD